MKKFIILLLVLSGVVAQAQRTWSPTAYAVFQDNARIVGRSTSPDSIQKYMDDVMKNCITPPLNPIYNKDGYVVAKKINLYKVSGKPMGAFYPRWEWIVTVDLVQGASPYEIKVKVGKDTLSYFSSSYQVPQNLKPEYKFVHYTKKEYDKASKMDKLAIENGRLNLKKITKADLKALGY